MAYLRCTSAFVDFRNGAVESYNPGRLVNDNDPVIKGRESYFEPVEVAAARHAGVEQATAAPGERRSRGRARKAAKKAPAKKTAAKPAEPDAAGTGDAVNAETGEVTKPGESLPEIKPED